jgi:hypothetical protein
MTKTASGGKSDASGMRGLLTIVYRNSNFADQDEAQPTAGATGASAAGVPLAGVRSGG